MKRLIGLGLIAFVVGTSTVVLADYNEPYKTTINGKISVYIPGQTPGQPANIASPSVPKAKVLTLNNCGISRISKGTISPIINISGVNFAGKTTGTKPTCILDKSTRVYTTNWAGTVGSVLDDGTAFYVKGGTGPGAMTINVTNDAKISTKANLCGTIRLNASATKPLSTFTVNGSDFTLAELPEKLPEQCKSSVKYLPQSGSSGG
jgi:hypothetical protein